MDHSQMKWISSSLIVYMFLVNFRFFFPHYLHWSRCVFFGSPSCVYTSFLLFFFVLWPILADVFFDALELRIRSIFFRTNVLVLIFLIGKFVFFLFHFFWTQCFLCASVSVFDAYMYANLYLNDSLWWLYFIQINTVLV